MRVKIVSDGTSFGTKVVNSETNEEIEDIQHVSWEISVATLATATICITRVPVEVSSDRVTVKEEKI